MRNKHHDPCYGRLCLRPYLDGPDPRQGSSLTGEIRRHEIRSKHLESERTVLVYLPPGYSERDSWPYPLVLLQDGQNVFDDRTAVFGVEWGVDESAEQLIVQQKIRPLILVAVYNSDNRIMEYTPIRDRRHGGGGAALYRGFLVEELFPFLEKAYTLSKRPEERAVIGSSLGGLLALYLGWTEPRQFGLVGALSPSLWWAERLFITGIGGDPTPTRLSKIWLDCGTLEQSEDGNGNGVPDLLDDLRTMRAVLRSQGYREERDLFYREFEGAKHDETAWNKRIGEVLKCFFPKLEQF